MTDRQREPARRSRFDVVEPGAVGADQAPGECVVEPERSGAVGDRVGALLVDADERFQAGEVVAQRA